MEAAIHRRTAVIRPPRDPRLYQIACLTGLLGYGLLSGGITLAPVIAIALIGGTLAFQRLCVAWFRVPRFDPRSPLISSLSLCLLLRTDSVLWALMAAALVVFGKFLLRVDGAHVWNPTGGAIALLLVVTDRVWITPGQWGTATLFALLLACAGGTVVQRAARSDVTWMFLAAHGALLFGRAAWLGDPWRIPWHQLQHGGLLIFAFFMISDPKTTPRQRGARIAFAVLVALLDAALRFHWHRPESLLWALALAAPFVPLVNRLAPNPTPRRPRPATSTQEHSPMSAFVPASTSRSSVSRPSMARASAALLVAFALAALTALVAPSSARAFCGFYVAQADAKLFNQASRVVLVRDGDRTVITMASDYRGEVEDFALVVPVPTVLQREQINVAEGALVDHLDAYTAPRLASYHDPNPCPAARRENLRVLESAAMDQAAPAAAMEAGARARQKVRVEATYHVGEYTIQILSADESDALAGWLDANGYRMPEGAAPILDSYLRQGMRFFVAKVNLDVQRQRGFSQLRPIQIAFESPKFMLPLRLGTVNADGPQELFVYAMTRQGRVEPLNYRTVRIPTDVELPPFVENDFGAVYKAIFDRQSAKHGLGVVFLEYAWDMAWCDPCAADPLPPASLRALGAFWVDPSNRGPAQDVFVTRLHLRYTADTFPDDLRLQVTGDRTNLQGRYVIRYPWTGKTDCPQGAAYREQLAQRNGRDASTLANLTGWPLADVWARIDGKAAGVPATVEPEEPWWKRLWGGGKKEGAGR